MWLRIYQHLLPRARAWKITIDKTLRRFFEGLAQLPAAFREFVDLVYRDLWPQTTRELDAWEEQWALPDTGLTEQQRRDRLAAQWRAVGGQSPRYLQDTLQANGFPVFVHEWWIPGSDPIQARNPFLYLSNNDAVGFGMYCGAPLAQAGEPTALAGSVFNGAGYPLVNKISVARRRLLAVAGAPEMQAGETIAQAGNYSDLGRERIRYPIPSNGDYWPYILYIGGENFPDLATIPQARRDEFEALCLKISPAQQWLGILVEYS